MQTVKVNREQVLATIKENLAKHIENYDATFEIYVEESIKAMRKNLKRATKDRVIVRTIDTVTPVSYEDSYNTVIAMLEFSVDQDIELDQQEFKQYVLDEWVWKKQFETTNAYYGAIGGSLKK